MDFTTLDNKIGEPVERKFAFEARSRTGHLFGPGHAMVFLARDLALVPTLEVYLSVTRALRGDGDQLKGIRLLLERVRRYQDANPDLVKVADLVLPAQEAVILPNVSA